MDKCGWCGQMHDTVCPLVKAIEYHPDGTVKRVEFKTAADYPPQPPPPASFPPWYPPTICRVS